MDVSRQQSSATDGAACNPTRAPQGLRTELGDDLEQAKVNLRQALSCYEAAKSARSKAGRDVQLADGKADECQRLVAKLREQYDQRCERGVHEEVMVELTSELAQAERDHEKSKADLEELAQKFEEAKAAIRDLENRIKQASDYVCQAEERLNQAESELREARRAEMLKNVARLDRANSEQGE